MRINFMDLCNSKNLEKKKPTCEESLSWPNFSNVATYDGNGYVNWNWSGLSLGEYDDEFVCFVIGLGFQFLRPIFAFFWYAGDHA